MKKRILVLNGTISEVPIIKKAQEMGFEVVTTGNMPNLIGHTISDQYIPEDYSNPEAILKLVRENNIEGIVSCANDFGVITSAYVAEAMKWKGHDSYKNAVMMHQKDKFMQYFRDNNLPAPWFEIFDNVDSAKTFVEGCHFPIIVKANDLTGGKGIMKAENLIDAKIAIDNAFSMSRDKHILIEPFLKGVQQSIVVFLINKKIVKCSTSNIYCMHNPYLVQAETYPAENFELVEDKLYKIIEFMAADLELVDGILSFQYIVVNGEPYVIDMMRRCFGNETLLLADEMTGFPWEEAYITAALGMDCSAIEAKEPTSKFCGHYGVMSTKNGKLLDYRIPEDILNRCFKRTKLIEIGDAIENCMVDKIELIYFRYEDIETMNREIVNYNSRISIAVKG